MPKSTLKLRATYDQHCFLIAAVTAAEKDEDLLKHIDPEEVQDISSQLIDKLEVWQDEAP